MKIGIQILMLNFIKMMISGRARGGPLIWWLERNHLKVESFRWQGRDGRRIKVHPNLVGLGHNCTVQVQKEPVGETHQRWWLPECEPEAYGFFQVDVLGPYLFVGQ